MVGAVAHCIRDARSTQWQQLNWPDWSTGHEGSGGNDAGTESYKLVVLKIGVLRIVLNDKATFAHCRKCIMCIYKKVKKCHS